ncbi:hypothetical protein [Azospirillum endophyticum]
MSEQFRYVVWIPEAIKRCPYKMAQPFRCGWRRRDFVEELPPWAFA